MNLRTIFTAAALTALFAAAPVVAHADHYGDWDDHHVWHDAGWCHASSRERTWRHSVLACWIAGGAYKCQR